MLVELKIVPSRTMSGLAERLVTRLEIPHLVEDTGDNLLVMDFDWLSEPNRKTHEPASYVITPKMGFNS